ncbi:hypothetical protein KJZ99_02405 [bacterium]|nr:hypothetical protein [bacterium]
MILLVVLLLTSTAALGQAGATLSVLVPPEESPFRSPKAIQSGLLDVLYIVDTGHNRLLALDSNGAITFESSQGSSGGELRWPSDLAIAPGGKVFVADAGNRRIIEYSRLLEWRGVLQVRSESQEDLEPRLLCTTRQGDLIVYESDYGQLLRYDAFYKISGRLGMRSGQNFAHSMSALSFSQAYGVMWIDQRGGRIYHCDQFLNEANLWLQAPQTNHFNALTAVDSFVFVTDDEHLWRISAGVRDSLGIQELFEGTGSSRDLIMTASTPERLYMLNRRSGALYRLDWP